MKEYLLVNPLISNINYTFKGSNSIEAAENAYKDFSSYFSHKVNNFNFTLLKTNSKNNKIYETNNSKFYHFKVNEKKNDDKYQYLITHIENDKIKNNKIDIFKLNCYRRLKKENKKKKLNGGKNIKKKLNIGKSKYYNKHYSDSGKSKYYNKHYSDSSDSSDSDSSDSDSSDSEYLKKKYKYKDNEIIPRYWWYSPSIYDFENISLPILVDPYTYYTLDLLNNIYNPKKYQINIKN